MGAAFALYEREMVLATILERQSLRSAETGRVLVVPRNTFLGPRGAIRVTAEPRAAA